MVDPHPCISEVHVELRRAHHQHRFQGFELEMKIGLIVHSGRRLLPTLHPRREDRFLAHLARHPFRSREAPDDARPLRRRQARLQLPQKVLPRRLVGLEDEHVLTCHDDADARQVEEQHLIRSDDAWRVGRQRQARVDAPQVSCREARLAEQLPAKELLPPRRPLDVHPHHLVHRCLSSHASGSRRPGSSAARARARASGAVALVRAR
mmetsp:Transcript_1904/g.6973  ORF Transcript_1904/g.6973 Transcript_1904/m.6973 type:complete len:208 (-) Transcript_1904:24-647(-)